MERTRLASRMLKAVPQKSRDAQEYSSNNAATMNRLVQPMNAAIERLTETYPGLAEQMFKHNADGSQTTEFIESLTPPILFFSPSDAETN